MAIKKFKDSEEDEIFKKTISREVKLLKMLKHSNIVQLKEAFKRKSRLFLVFEYVEKNLLEVIEQHPTGLPVLFIQSEKIKSYMHQLIQAISFCHSQSVIHRDIKPENLLISSLGELKLCDFGFARIIQQGDHLTDYVATRWYRAPELLVGVQYDESVDMWAIGCLMAELIDSQPLFPGESDADQVYCIQKHLGELITEHQEAIQKNKLFSGLKLPKVQRIESIRKRYEGKIEKEAIELILALIKKDPKDRLTAQQALAHEYFASAAEEARPQTMAERGRQVLRQKISVNTPVFGARIREVCSDSVQIDKRKAKPGRGNLKLFENGEPAYRTNSNGPTKNQIFLKRRMEHIQDKGKTQLTSSNLNTLLQKKSSHQYK